MCRLLPPLLAGFLLGCGDGEDAQRSASPSASASPATSEEGAVDCSSARENLTARDFAGRPKKGYELLEMDPERAELIAGGQEGTLVEAADGAFIAISPAGECSFAVLIADTERTLRDGAALIASG